MIKLHIQMTSKPEMTLEELRRIVFTDFPADTLPNAEVTADTETGIISLALHQHTLTNEQLDWLHMTPFAARYIDSFTTEQVPGDTISISYKNLGVLLNAFDQANEGLEAYIESNYTSLSESEFSTERARLKDMQERYKEREQLYSEMHEFYMQGSEGMTYLLTFPHE